MERMFLSVLHHVNSEVTSKGKLYQDHFLPIETRVALGGIKTLHTLYNYSLAFLF